MVISTTTYSFATIYTTISSAELDAALVQSILTKIVSSTAAISLSHAVVATVVFAKRHITPTPAKHAIADCSSVFST